MNQTEPLSALIDLQKLRYRKSHFKKQKAESIKRKSLPGSDTGKITAILLLGWTKAGSEGGRPQRGWQYFKEHGLRHRHNPIC
jgi:hypothetical protein